MLSTKRIEILTSLSLEKQLAYGVLCCERAYLEVFKVFPKGMEQSPIFKEAIDKLWAYLSNGTKLKKEELKIIDLEIFKYVKDELDLEPRELRILPHPIVTSLARSINLTINIILTNSETAKLSSSCVGNVRHIIGQIYEDLDNTREMSLKELEWLTKALYLIAESDEVPPNYEWFLERNPDYERRKIYKDFRDIE